MTALPGTHQSSRNDTAIVLCISGHDPSGGAGIQADIETIHSLGGHAASLITCHTVQDSTGLQELLPVDTPLLRRQAALLLADLPIAAIKLGALGSAAVAAVARDVIHQARRANPGLPVVIDPVVAASAGTASQFCDAQTLASIREQLLPLASLATPNLAELEVLSGINGDSKSAALALLEQGCHALLVTGSDSPAPSTAPVVHRLYTTDHPAQSFSCERLNGQYHGSGCTLAAALALFLAQGLELSAAVEQSLEYCWQSLARGRQLGRGQCFPDRRPAQQPAPGKA